jgi:hypothetical protein
VVMPSSLFRTLRNSVFPNLNLLESTIRTCAPAASAQVALSKRLAGRCGQFSTFEPPCLLNLFLEKTRIPAPEADGQAARSPIRTRIRRRPASTVRITLAPAYLVPLDTTRHDSPATFLVHYTHLNTVQYQYSTVFILNEGVLYARSPFNLIHLKLSMAHTNTSQGRRHIPYLPATATWMKQCWHGADELGHFMVRFRKCCSVPSPITLPTNLLCIHQSESPSLGSTVRSRESGPNRRPIDPYSVVVPH